MKSTMIFPSNQPVPFAKAIEPGTELFILFLFTFFSGKTKAGGITPPTAFAKHIMETLVPRSAPVV
jgi:hypothetical protein